MGKDLRHKWKTAAELEEHGPEIVQDYLTVTDRWFDSLRDRGRGNVGREFNRRFAASHCHDGSFETARDESDGLAAFKLFSPFLDYARNTYFQNKIIYRGDTLSSPEQFFLSRGHERIHAIQAARAPILHADISNKGSNIILCPRDQILLVELMERDAYAKNGWLASLACRDHPGIRKESAKHIESVAEFEAMRKKSHGLQQTLSRMAQRAMKAKIADPVVRGMTAGEHYRDSALNTYALMLNNRQYAGGPLTVIRLSPEDIWAIGNSFGPNTFGKNRVDPEFLKRPRLSAGQERMIAMLNERLGIEDEKKLPSLRQALRAQNMTLKQFMAQSRGEGKKVPSRPYTPA